MAFDAYEVASDPGDRFVEEYEATSHQHAAECWAANLMRCDPGCGDSLDCYVRREGGSWSRWHVDIEVVHEFSVSPLDEAADAVEDAEGGA